MYIEITCVILGGFQSRALKNRLCKPFSFKDGRLAAKYVFSIESEGEMGVIVETQPSPEGHLSPTRATSFRKTFSPFCRHLLQRRFFFPPLQC